jgi:hypothetical protein
MVEQDGVALAVGQVQKPPRLWAMACTAPRMALEKASPA